MERGYLSLVIALFLGSAIGSVLAVDIFSTTFWWAGALIGGVVGYLTCGWRQIFPAIKQAWIYARNEVPFGKYFKLGAINILGQTITWINFTTTLCLWAWWVDEKLKNVSGINIMITSLFFGVAFGIIIGIAKTITTPRANLTLDTNEACENLFQFFLPLIAVRLCFKILFGGGTLVARFFSRLYLEIRSSKRNICFLSCATGATIAHFWGHALLGTVAGLLVGLALHRLVYKPVEATKAH